MERCTVKIIEDTPILNGWSKSKIKCISENKCDGELPLNVLFEEGHAVATKEDELICPKCGLIIGIDENLRLQ